MAEKALDIYTPLYETKQGDQIQEIEDKLGYAAILNNIAVLYKRMENYDKSADFTRIYRQIYSPSGSGVCGVGIDGKKEQEKIGRISQDERGADREVWRICKKICPEEG